MSSKLKGYIKSYLMLLPNLFLFLVITVYPVIWALRYMFYEYDGIREPRFVGLDNFVRVLTRDHLFWESALNTLVYGLGILLFALPLGFIVAYLLNKTKKIYGGLQAIIFSPTIMSSAVMSLVFFLLFNVFSGEINRILMNAGIIQTPINWLGVDLAMTTVIIVAVWGILGNYMVYFLAGLQQIDVSVYESAEIDGITPFKRITHITIPLLGPVLKMILMIAIIFAFQNFESIMVLTGGGPVGRTNVMFLYLFSLYFPSSDMAGFTPQFGYGAAVSVVAATLIGIVTVIFLKISKKLDEIY